MSQYFWLPSIQIKGYRPFGDTLFRFKPLQVIVGANGSGKSSLFEFLKFIRDACHQEIPPDNHSDFGIEALEKKQRTDESEIIL